MGSREGTMSRDAYVIFVHIDVLLFVEGKLFIYGFEEGYDISVVIPHENVTHRLHPIATPQCVTESVVSIGYIYIIEATVEPFLGR